MTHRRLCLDTQSQPPQYHMQSRPSLPWTVPADTPLLSGTCMPCSASRRGRSTAFLATCCGVINNHMTSARDPPLTAPAGGQVRGKTAGANRSDCPGRRTSPSPQARQQLLLTDLQASVGLSAAAGDAPPVLPTEPLLLLLLLLPRLFQLLARSPPGGCCAAGCCDVLLCKVNGCCPLLLGRANDCCSLLLGWHTACDTCICCCWCPW